MNKLVKSFAIAVSGLAASALVFAAASPVFADSPGQLTTGANVLLAKNITAGGSYASTVSAACNDVVQYSVELHNAAFGGLTNVIVSANLSNNTISAVPAEGASAGTTGSVGVSIPSGASLAYQGGTTILYNEIGTVISTMPDTITSGGVNVGNIAGSTTEFVNFRAKVNCPSTPTPTPPAKTVTTPTKTTPAPKALPNTGAGDVLGIFAGASAAGTAAHMAVTARRNRR